MMKDFSMLCVEPVNGPILIVRNRAEMHVPTEVPANGGRVTVPTRPSGSKSTRIVPAPNGPAELLHEARPKPMRSTSFWAFERGNGPIVVTVGGGAAVIVGGGVGTGTKVAVGRGVRTVGAVLATLLADELAAGAASAVSMRGCAAVAAVVAGSGAGSAEPAAATSTMTTAPKPSRTTAAIPPRIHGKEELPPAPGALPAKVEDVDGPSGAPHERQ